MSKIISQDIAALKRGSIVLKNAPVITKEAPTAVKRGDRVELKLNFTAASDEEVKKALGNDAPEGYIAGWASTSSRDLYNHEVVSGAFQEAIDQRGLTGPRGIKLLLDHNWEKPAGVIKVLEYRRGKLWMEAQMNLEVGYVRERWQMLKMMGGANFSVGFMLLDYQVITQMVDGDEEWHLQIDRGDLFEVSIVLFPGNEEATMTFVKAAMHEDNPANDQLFFAKTNKPAWRMSASKNLPLLDTEEWDSSAAKARVFKAAGIDTDKPNLEMLQKAFLAYDSANPTLRTSYKMLVADIVDGKLQVTLGGLKAAAARIDATDVPDALKKEAHGVVNHYEERELDEIITRKGAPKSLADFEKTLIAKGLAKSRNDARAIALVAKSCPALFQKTVEEIRPAAPELDTDMLAETIVRLKRLNASLQG